jgi:hypothetical protein
MLTKEQGERIASAIRDGARGFNPNFTAEVVCGIVEEFLDPIRPRDPKVELPPEGRVVLCSIPDDGDGLMVVTGSLGREWRPDGAEAPLVWRLDKREHRRGLVRYWWPAPVQPHDSR